MIRPLPSDNVSELKTSGLAPQKKQGGERAKGITRGQRQSPNEGEIRSSRTMAECGAKDDKVPPHRTAPPRSTSEEEERELSGTGTTSVRPSTASRPSRSPLSFKERRGRLRSQAATAAGACGGRRAWLAAALFGVAGLLAACCDGGGGAAASDGRTRRMLREKVPPPVEDQESPGPQVQRSFLEDNKKRRNNEQPAITFPVGTEEGVTKRYGSFREFALEQISETESNNEEDVRVPVVALPEEGPEATLSLPVAIIIGVQKGGTQDLRGNFLTHPLLSGRKGREIHYFDAHYGFHHEWPGDGHESDEPLTADAAGDILRSYAERSGRDVAPADRNTKVGVDSSPMYVFHPLVPFRMKMVLPHARIVLLLRDPTERYYSHLRMNICSMKKLESFEEFQARTSSDDPFHAAGNAEEYLEQAEAWYEPYTPLCRGEGATAADLKRCWQILQKFHPIYRGLYAEQLERWFRVFDRSQILIVESAEMFRDFTSTLDAVTRHAGLPPHDFEYDSTYQHGTCEKKRPDLFATGRLYDILRQEEKLFRDWYRPHNQRLYKLLGRELSWE